MKKHFSRSSKYVLGLFAFVFVLTWTFGIGYGEATRLDADHPSIRAATIVLKRHAPKLMGIPGVVGMGTGIGPNDQPIIKLYTTRAQIAAIPKSLDGFPVQEEVTGIIVAFACPGGPECWWNRPVPIGVSTGHPDITAGTIGFKVTDSAGNVYALSNNHVYANQNDATTGDDVIQPGTIDGGSVGPNPAVIDGDEIGTLFQFVDINFSGGDNTVDAAIALSTSVHLGNATPAGGYGTPSSATVTAYVGQPVQKYGRITGWTTGTVAEIVPFLDVCYECLTLFGMCIICT